MPFDGTGLDDVTKLLIEGRERIEQGWCQGTMRQRGAVCANGALFSPGYGIKEYGTFVLAARRLERAASTDNVARWNDAPERTKDEVLAAYDTAIANG